MELNNVWFAFGLTLFASLATGVGSAIAFFAGMAFIAVIDSSCCGS